MWMSPGPLLLRLSTKKRRRSAEASDRRCSDSSAVTTSSASSRRAFSAGENLCRRLPSPPPLSVAEGVGGINGSGVGPSAAVSALSRTTAAVNRRFVGLMAGRGAPAGLVCGHCQRSKSSRGGKGGTDRFSARNTQTGRKHRRYVRQLLRDALRSWLRYCISEQNFSKPPPSRTFPIAAATELSTLGYMHPPMRRSTTARSHVR